MAFVYDISTFKQDGITSPITVVGVVWPQVDGSVFVRDFMAMPKYLRFMKQFIFRHTPDGTTVNLVVSDGRQEDPVARSFYPPARRCCRTLTVDDSHRESMRLDRPYEQAITRPLSHDELEVLRRCAQATRFAFDLAGQGHGMARPKGGSPWLTAGVL